MSKIDVMRDVAVKAYGEEKLLNGLDVSTLDDIMPAQWMALYAKVKPAK